MLSYILLAILPAPLLSYDHQVDYKYGACSPWIYRIENGFCYRKYCNRQKFNEAAKVCQNLLGGFLATSCDKETNEFLARLAEWNYPPGMRRDDAYTLLGMHWSGGRWKWHNQPYASKRKECDTWHPWHPGEPDGALWDYFVTFSNGYPRFDLWNDFSAHTSYFFICEIPNCDHYSKIGL